MSSSAKASTVTGSFEPQAALSLVAGCSRKSKVTPTGQRHASARMRIAPMGASPGAMLR